MQFRALFVDNAKWEIFFCSSVPHCWTFRKSPIDFGHFSSESSPSETVDWSRVWTEINVNPTELIPRAEWLNGGGLFWCARHRSHESRSAASRFHGINHPPTALLFLPARHVALLWPYRIIIFFFFFFRKYTTVRFYK